MSCNKLDDLDNFVASDLLNRIAKLEETVQELKKGYDELLNLFSKHIKFTNHKCEKSLNIESGKKFEIDDEIDDMMHDFCIKIGQKCREKIDELYTKMKVIDKESGKKVEINYDKAKKIYSAIMGQCSKYQRDCSNCPFVSEEMCLAYYLSPAISECFKR